MTFKIEDRVPLPLKKARYPFKSLKVGQSFFVPGNQRNSLASSIAYAKKRTGFSFTSAFREEEGVLGLRVWRIANEETEPKTNLNAPASKPKRKST